MRIRPVVNGVRQDFSPKRFLLRLNQDLDKTLQRIDGKQFDRFRFNHSHSSDVRHLSNLQLAILFLEDSGFFSHRGFELRAPIRVRTHNQKITAAARAIAERKTVVDLS